MRHRLTVEDKEIFITGASTRIVSPQISSRGDESDDGCRFGGSEPGRVGLKQSLLQPGSSRWVGSGTVKNLKNQATRHAKRVRKKASIL
jgi:hypothetical protein